MQRIPVAGPWITDKEVQYVAEAAARGWYEYAGAYQARFEKAFQEYVGRKYAIALPSCTSALHLALLGLGIGPGDEVVVPDITWIATSAPINYVGATPVFADVDPSSWCITPDSLQQRLTSRTRAVIAVDLYGNMPDLPAIASMAEAKGIHLIEDSAEAVGSEYNGRIAGSFGAASAFSFHGSKTLTTGEGGMLLTDSEALYTRCRFLADHGRTPGDPSFWNTEIAFKYKMSGVQAALGLAQLERVSELVERKRQIFEWYREELGEIPGVTLNGEGPGVRNSYWMVTVVLDPEFSLPKSDLISALAKLGVDCRPFFNPLSMLPAYSESAHAIEAQRANTVAYRVAPYGVNLPSALTLTRDQVHYVCNGIRQALPKMRAS